MYNKLAKFYTFKAENIRKSKGMADQTRAKVLRNRTSILTDNSFGLEDENKLSVQSLKNHIRQNHPKKTNEEDWPLLESISNLYFFKSERKIPKVLNDIGLGASLYLLTLKAYTILFLILTIINIPIFLLYVNGAQGTGKNFEFRIFIAQLSLGNIGSSGPTCSEVNLARNTGSIIMGCPSGKFTHIISVGMNKDLDQ